MGVNKVRMHVNAFFGDNEIELCFPENWAVTECRIAGHDKPPLTDDEMRKALQKPYGSPLLSELAKDAKEVCILFDDLPKPTPTKDIVPFVLEQLHAGGVTDEHIRFLCAPGTHHPLTDPEFVAKLGKDVVEGEYTLVTSPIDTVTNAVSGVGNGLNRFGFGTKMN